MRKGILVIITTLFFIGVNGQPTAIPDPNFEQALINLGLDSGVPDGVVPTANIDTVTYLVVSTSNISSLTGIEDFISLTTLACDGNQLTSLNVSQNVLLTLLYCSGNQLTSLDVTQNLALEILAFPSNQLTSIDVTQNVVLTELYCRDNQLNSLDLTQNLGLIHLDCDANQLTSLNVTQNLALQTLIVTINQLTNLDVTQNTVLQKLFCGINQLIKLDVTQNLVLSELECSNNQLSCLNVKNGNNSNFLTFIAFGNANLSCIEVDDVAWSTANWTSIDAGVSFDANCFAACSPVGINESDVASEFTLYPNPAFNNVTIDFEKEEQQINLSVVNIHGQQVLSNAYENTDGIRLNVADLSAGIYMANIITQDGQKTIKFIKE